MSEVVSTFVNVDRGKSKYLFFLVRVNDYESTIKEEIEKNWLPFGEALGVNGTAVKAYDQKKNSTYGEVTKKPWPTKLLDQMWRRLIPLSQVDQYLGPAGRIRNGTAFDFFGRS
jgi:hypothetical protein